MARIRYFQTKIPREVTDPLESVLKHFPEYRSTADAIKHAIVFFTKELERRLKEEGPQEVPVRRDGDPPEMDEIIGLIRRYYQDRPPAAKRDR